METPSDVRDEYRVANWASNDPALVRVSFDSCTSATNRLGGWEMTTGRSIGMREHPVAFGRRRNAPMKWARKRATRRADESGPARKLLEGLAPQPGLEPGTLRLTGGTGAGSRRLLTVASHCRIPHLARKNRVHFQFRLVRPFAATCCALLWRKGKNRATSSRRSRWSDTGATSSPYRLTSEGLQPR